MLDYVFYALGATNHGPTPVLLIDLRLGVLTAQETLDVVKSIVRELELITADFPGVDMMRLREGVQRVVNQSGVDERDVKISTEVSDSKISLRIYLLSKKLHQTSVI